MARGRFHNVAVHAAWEHTAWQQGAAAAPAATRLQVELLQTKQPRCLRLDFFRAGKGTECWQGNLWVSLILQRLRPALHGCCFNSPPPGFPSLLPPCCRSVHRASATAIPPPTPGRDFWSSVHFEESNETLRASQTRTLRTMYSSPLHPLPRQHRAPAMPAGLRHPVALLCPPDCVLFPGSTAEGLALLSLLTPSCPRIPAPLLPAVGALLF